jgi:hypothetical protein
LGKDFGDGIEMEREEDASAGDGGDAEKAAAIEERSLHRASWLLAKIVAGRRRGPRDTYCNAVYGDLVSPISRGWNKNLIRSSFIAEKLDRFPLQAGPPRAKAKLRFVRVL